LEYEQISLGLSGVVKSLEFSFILEAPFSISIYSRNKHVHHLTNFSPLGQDVDESENKMVAA
jgi:hypothetical protein